MLVDQRYYASRLGGHVLSRHFRYYIPEFSGRIVVQTPIVVRWVSLIISCFSVWFSAVLGFRTLAAVGCCCFVVYSVVLSSVLMSAIFILWWQFSVLKCSKLMFMFAEQCEVLCVFWFLFYVVLSFFQWFGLFSSKFPWGWRLWSGWVILL